MSPTEQPAADEPETIPFEDAAVDNTVDELQLLQEQVQLEKNNYLRTLAELENFRKRSQRELQESRQYAEIDLLLDLLPIVDNMERGLAAAQKQSDATTLLQGFQMLTTQLQEVLTKHKCVAINKVGEAFDPNLHQAIMQQPSADCEPNTVLMVAVTGYRLHERTIRPAQVIVSKAAE
jgi:molecular chaperone GrpE